HDLVCAFKSADFRAPSRPMTIGSGCDSRPQPSLAGHEATRLQRPRGSFQKRHGVSCVSGPLRIGYLAGDKDIDPQEPSRRRMTSVFLQNRVGRNDSSQLVKRFVGVLDFHGGDRLSIVVDSGRCMHGVSPEVRRHVRRQKCGYPVRRSLRRLGHAQSLDRCS
ncbi:MAG TPA: hypothetical protein VI258_05080, partial [Rhodanobacteraceae bacterium]